MRCDVTEIRAKRKQINSYIYMGIYLSTLWWNIVGICARWNIDRIWLFGISYLYSYRYSWSEFDFVPLGLLISYPFFEIETTVAYDGTASTSPVKSNMTTVTSDVTSLTSSVTSSVTTVDPTSATQALTESATGNYSSWLLRDFEYLTKHINNFRIIRNQSSVRYQIILDHPIINFSPKYFQ